MRHTFHIATPHTLLLKGLMVLCAVMVCMTGLTPTVSAQPCDDGEVSAEADEPCAQLCAGESPGDDDCSDDCQFCSCCSMAAPAALVCASMGAGLAAPVYRGDLPPAFNARLGGISLGIFKPPRHLSA